MESSERPRRAGTNGDEALVKVEDVLARADDTVRTLVSQHPVLTLLGAAAIGYFAGRIITRR